MTKKVGHISLSKVATNVLQLLKVGIFLDCNCCTKRQQSLYKSCAKMQLILKEGVEYLKSFGV